MRQTDIVAAVGRDAGWVSRTLRAPGNWTLRTIGELVEALNGEIEIIVHAKEEPTAQFSNYHAYAEYMPPPLTSETGAFVGGTQVIGAIPAGFSGRPA